MEYRILDCSMEDPQYICDKLVEYNNIHSPQTQEPAFIDINKKIIDENGQIVAGFVAEMYCWKVIYVDMVWVDETCRHQGLGTKLIRELERIALEEGCTLIHLDTFDFQAKDFYIKLGYEVFGVLDGFPGNHCRYFLKKQLKPVIC